MQVFEFAEFFLFSNWTVDIFHLKYFDNNSIARTVSLAKIFDRVLPKRARLVCARSRCPLAEPDHVRAQNNKRYYEEAIAKAAADKSAGPSNDDAADMRSGVKNERKLDEYRNSQEFRAYEALCRGEKTHVRTAWSLAARVRTARPLAARVRMARPLATRERKTWRRPSPLVYVCPVHKAQPGPCTYVRPRPFVCVCKSCPFGPAPHHLSMYVSKIWPLLPA